MADEDDDLPEGRSLLPQTGPVPEPAEPPVATPEGDQGPGLIENPDLSKEGSSGNPMVEQTIDKILAAVPRELQRQTVAFIQIGLALITDEKTRGWASERYEQMPGKTLPDKVARSASALMGLVFNRVRDAEARRNGLDKNPNAVMVRNDPNFPFAALAFAGQVLLLELIMLLEGANRIPKATPQFVGECMENFTGFLLLQFRITGGMIKKVHAMTRNDPSIDQEIEQSNQRLAALREREGPPQPSAPPQQPQPQQPQGPLIGRPQ